MKTDDAMFLGVMACFILAAFPMFLLYLDPNKAKHSKTKVAVYIWSALWFLPPGVKLYSFVLMN